MSHEFDPRVIHGSRGERRITSQQRCPKRFGEGDVNGVVRCDIMTQFPDPQQKEIMRVSGQWKIGKIFERLEPPSGVKFTGPRISAKDLCDLDIEKMGCMKFSSGSKNRSAIRFPVGVFSNTSMTAEASTTITDLLAPL